MNAPGWTQLTLFDADGQVPRPPGWSLVANGHGTIGWHLVARTTSERGVATVCGVDGRVVQSPSRRAIAPCPACTAAS